MIGECTKLTRALACSAASGDEPGAGRRDSICSSLSFEAYCDPYFSSASYYPERKELADTINRLMIKQRFFRSL